MHLSKYPFVVYTNDTNIACIKEDKKVAIIQYVRKCQ